MASSTGAGLLLDLSQLPVLHDAAAKAAGSIVSASPSASVPQKVFHRGWKRALRAMDRALCRCGQAGDCSGCWHQGEHHLPQHPESVTEASQIHWLVIELACSRSSVLSAACQRRQS
eukprot:s194_g4.t1